MLLIIKNQFVRVQVMKAHWTVEVYLHPFLTSVLDGDGQLAVCIGRFSLGESPRRPLGGRQRQTSSLPLLEPVGSLPCLQ